MWLALFVALAQEDTDIPPLPLPEPVQQLDDLAVLLEQVKASSEDEPAEQEPDEPDDVPRDTGVYGPVLTDESEHGEVPEDPPTLFEPEPEPNL